MPTPFVHLRVHSHYSLLQSTIRLPELCARVREWGMPAVALTDDGNLFGAVELCKEARAAGVKPILGCDLYVAPRSRHDRPEGMVPGNEPWRLVVLAENEAGYRNLVRLVSIGYVEGLHRVPRVDVDVLARHHEGLIALSGGASGEVATHLARGQEAEATTAARRLADVFGQDGFYLALEDHGLPGQIEVCAALAALGRKLDLPTVALNDCRFLDAAGVEAHRALYCIGTGATLEDPISAVFTPNHCFRPPDDMARAFGAWPEALAATVAIADRCGFEIAHREPIVPDFAVPAGETLETFFRRKTREGLEARRRAWGQLPPGARVPIPDGDYDARLQRELDVLCGMGLAGYFLIVWDVVRFAREQGIPVGPGRGSVAGSLVSYCLEITSLDPLQHGLIFERFINPERKSLPDIDMDFCQRRRGEIIDYVKRKYGEDRVAQIITFGTLSARSVIRDVGRVMNMTFGEVDRIAKLVPEELGVTLDRALAEAPALESLRQSDERIRRLIELARPLEGLARNAGMHAAGVIISPEPIMEIAPLFRTGKNEITTQFAKDDAEHVGLLKMDFLGLKTLTVLDDCVRSVAAREGVRVELDTLPLDDPQTYELFRRARSLGIFQFESSGMRDVLRKMGPERLDDLVALNALYRPGPLRSGVVDDFVNRRHGRIKVSYLHPDLEPILKATHGVMVYQEQVMQVAVQLAGFSLAEADDLRKAMGKKRKEVMAAQREKFVRGAVARGVAEDRAAEIFEVMEVFAEYGFNKCVAGSTPLMDARTGERTTVEALSRDRRPFVVHALDARYRLVPRRVVDVVKNGKKPVLELRTAQGYVVTATGNHPFRTLDGWTLLEKLAPGDRIAVARELRVPTRTTCPADEIRLLAALMLRAQVEEPGVLRVQLPRRPLAQRVFAIARHLLRRGATVSLDRTPRGRPEIWFRAAGTRGAARRDARRARATASGAALRRTWGGLAGLVERLPHLADGSGGPRVPGWAFELRDEDVCRLLAGLWSVCGQASAHATTAPWFSAPSAGFGRDVQALLLRLGIISGVRPALSRYPEESHPHAVHVVGTGSVGRFVERVLPHVEGHDQGVAHVRARFGEDDRRPSPKDIIPAAVRWWVIDDCEAAGLTLEQLEKRSDVCTLVFQGEDHSGRAGFRHDTILKLGRALKSRRLLDVASSDVFWDRIVSIVPAGTRETYDLTVEGEHSFVAGGPVVHNSHSAAYALVAYWSAYLKAHHPAHFMAAMLTSEGDNTAKVVRHIAECKEIGLEVLPPDVNESDVDFSVVGGGKIRFGLSAIKGVGRSAVESILDARRRVGRFGSLHQFCAEIDLRLNNKKVLEALVKAGALDGLAAGRSTLMFALDSAVDAAQALRADRESGQASLFGGDEPARPPAPPELPEMPPWTKADRLRFEKEVLGFYVSGHPLEEHAAVLPRLRTAQVADLPERHGSEVTVAGIVTALRKTRTKRGDWMAFLTVEDLTGAAEVIAFPEAWKACSAWAAADAIACVKGTVEVEGDKGKLIAQAITPLARAQEAAARGVVVRFPAAPARQVEDTLARTDDLLLQHQGDCPVTFELEVPEVGRVLIAAGSRFGVRPEPEVIAALEQLVGPGRVDVELR
jgi:DNA polymerase-3 subunit alpha